MGVDFVGFVLFILYFLLIISPYASVDVGKLLDIEFQNLSLLLSNSLE